MSTHPNAILLLTLTPHGLARKTRRDILAETSTEEDGDIPIGTYEIETRDGTKTMPRWYHQCILELDYDDGWQIGGKEGDILVFNFVTYGYGEQISWLELESRKTELETWAKGICERHHCDYAISITANYW